MSLVGGIARCSLPVLLRLDPELAHDLGLAGLDLMRPFWPLTVPPPQSALSCLGLNFAHPLGLAAGFDKNGDHLDALGALGFSHVELGTVTPRPQPGNAKPRMFRAPRPGAGQPHGIQQQGRGSPGLAARARALPRVSAASASARTPTPRIEDAVDDYASCLRKVYAHADYIAVNVSSPNTARLRELQERDGLERILGALLQERVELGRRHGKRVPLLVKVAPDLEPAPGCRAGGDSALARHRRGHRHEYHHRSLQPSGPPGRRAARGLSGAPLHARSSPSYPQLRAELGRGFPIIGVGGIVGAERALGHVARGRESHPVLYRIRLSRAIALLEEILDALGATSACGCAASAAA